MDTFVLGKKTPIAFNSVQSLFLCEQLVSQMDTSSERTITAQNKCCRSVMYMQGMNKFYDIAMHTLADPLIPKPQIFIIKNCTHLLNLQQPNLSMLGMLSKWSSSNLSTR